MSNPAEIDYVALVPQLRSWAQALGFDELGIAGVALEDDEQKLLSWLDAGHHGTMSYMAAHGTKRSRPGELLPGTVRVISVRMNYLWEHAAPIPEILAEPDLGFVSRYALGRDYHRVMRRRLQRLADQIESAIGPFGYRAFVDSAPVLEKPLARAAGLGWVGKHTNLLSRGAGSWFFLGELYTDLPLPVSVPVKNHCGSCTACIDICPTAAIVAPYQLDATRCISYLTIEHHGSIPVEFRAAIGNRIYGCDDCQMVCPWNRRAVTTKEPDFTPRHGLDRPRLVDLFKWTKPEFLRNTEGSAIRRIGYERWLRNIAVALGNAPSTPDIIAALEARHEDPSDLVCEHVRWALEQHRTWICE